MPSISDAGRIAAGSGIISIDRHVIAQGGGGTALARWIDADSVIYQDERNKVVQHNVTTDSIEQREDFGANDIAAGGDCWATWLAGVGLRHSLGGLMQSAGLKDVGRDGTLALCPNRQSGVGLNFIALQDADPASRRFLNFEDVVADSVHVHSWGNAVWKNERGETAALIGGRLLTIPTIAPVFRPRLLSVDGEWWIAYNTNEEPRGRTLLHPITVTEGYVIADGDSQFGLDALALDTTRILFTWAATEGEDPSQITVAEFNLRTHRLTGAGDDRILAYEKLTRRTSVPPVVVVPNPKPVEPPKEKPLSDTIEAPAHLDVVQSVLRDHPEINTKDETDSVRGVAVNYVARRLNGGGERPWGRKARQSNGDNQNGDGLTYLRSDGRFEIIDVLTGVNENGEGGEACWNHAGIFGQGENGYWAAPGQGEANIPSVEQPKTVKWPANGNEIVAAAMAKFPGANKGTDNAKRDITYAIAQQLAVMDQAFGAKKASPTRDISKNAIGYNANPLVGFVLFTDAGDPILNPVVTPMGGQVFVPVAPDNWMGLSMNGQPKPDEPKPDEPKPDEPKPSTDIEARLRAAEVAIATLNNNDKTLHANDVEAAAQIAALKQEVAALKAGTPTTPSAGGTATEATLKKILALLEGLAGKLPLAA